MIGIYCITNLVNNKKYIGSSIDISRRINRHKNRLNNNCHANIYLQNSWNKHGEQSFKFEVIEECSKDNLINRENYWITYYNCLDTEYGYNRREAGPRGTFTLEVRKHLSKMQRGRKQSPETIEKYKGKRSGENNGMYGKTHSSITRKVLSYYNKGRVPHNKGIPHTEETKRKIGDANRGRKLTEEHKQKNTRWVEKLC